MLLIVSSSLLPLAATTVVSMAQAAPAPITKAETRLKAAAPVSKTRVPAAALAALSRARRLMTSTMAQADEANTPAIEISLQHAIALAPEWIEARRVLARWKTVRHQWNAAAMAWQAVLALSPHDREAQNEFKRTSGHISALDAPFPAVAEQTLVSFGHDLSGRFDDDLWTVTPWKYHSLLETRVSARIERLGVRPLPPLPTVNLKATELKAAEEIVAPASIKAVEKATSKPSESTTSVETPVVPIVPGVATVIVPDEGIPVPSADTASEETALELPPAPQGVPLQARVALARGRQLAGLVEALPEAENWALTELKRAVELAPQWAEAQREMALWQEEHDDWNGAMQSWEQVVSIAPADVQARLALQNAFLMVEAQNLWANRSMVSIGHDSANPVGQSDKLSLQVLAAPLPAPDSERDSEKGSATLDDKEPSSQLALSLLPRLALNDAVKVEVQAAAIAVGSAGEDKILLAQAPAAPTTPVAPEAPVIAAPTEITPAVNAPVAPVDTSADTLVPVAPAPVPPSVLDAATSAPPAIDLGVPTPSGEGADNQPPATLTPVPIVPPAVGGSAVNVKTVLPGAASLPKPVVKKPLKKPVKPTRKAAKVPVKKAKPSLRGSSGSMTSKKRAAAAWPWVNLAGKAMAAKKFPAALDYYQKAYALDPKNPYSLYGIPTALSILKRYPEAIAGYKRFLASYSNHPKALRGLADAYTFSGQFEEAAALNARIVASNPKDFGAALQAAQVLAWSKKYEESGRFYRMALAVQPNNGVVWTEYAETLSYAKDERAREAFGRALDLNPHSQRAMLGLANLLSWSGDYATAVPYYGEVLKADPNNLKARIALGDALTFSSRAAMAIGEYETALKLAPDSPEARLGLGRALTIAKQYPEAIAILSQLVKEQPANAEALGMLGVAQIFEQPGAALVTFENLLKLQDQPAARAATLANIGDLRVKLNQPDEARAAYDEAIKLAPQDNKIALSYIRALMRSELYAEAEPLLAGVLQRDPANQSGLILQATAAARMGQNERAAALTEQLQTMPLEVSDDALNLFYALRGSSNLVAANRLLAQLAEAGNATPENLIKVANAVRDSGQAEASYALYQRVLQADPENTTAHLELAEAYMRRKEFEAAQKEVDAVLARQPGSVIAKVMGATLALRRARNDSSFDNATIVAKEALEKDPQNIPARMLVAEVAATRSNFALAAESYRAVLETQPNNLQAHLGLARNLYYLKQVEDSIKEYQLLIQQAPDDATIKLELAQVFLDRNRLDEAQRLFVDVLKAANYALPPSIATLARRVPGSGDIVSDETQRALREFASQNKNRQGNKIGG